jgi:hypothetical protein
MRDERLKEANAAGAGVGRGAARGRTPPGAQGPAEPAGPHHTQPPPPPPHHTQRPAARHALLATSAALPLRHYLPAPCSLSTFTTASCPLSVAQYSAVLPLRKEKRMLISFFCLLGKGIMWRNKRDKLAIGQ